MDVGLATPRRDILLGGASLFAVVMSSAGRAAAQVLSPFQPGWRFCNKCSVLFSLDNKSKACAGGGPHQAQGLPFQLPRGTDETATAQTKWFACRNCAALSYAGFPQHGRCPANAQYTTDAGHEPDRTFIYSIPHDTTREGRSQAGWRFCTKCMAMVFPTPSNPGKCAAGGGHVAQGFDFVLPVQPT